MANDVLVAPDDPGREEKNLDRLLRNAAAVIDELRSALAEAKPKVEAYHELMDSDGTCTLGHAAKIIGWPGGQGEFYEYLKNKGDIFSKLNYDRHPSKREYFPTESARGKIYYTEDVGSVQCGNRKVVVHTTKVTATGLDHLRRLIKKDFDLEDDE